MSIKGIYDIHCHIVPGVDDGATDIGETVKLLRINKAIYETFNEKGINFPFPQLTVHQGN